MCTLLSSPMTIIFKKIVHLLILDFINFFLKHYLKYENIYANDNLVKLSYELIQHRFLHIARF